MENPYDDGRSSIAVDAFDGRSGECDACPDNLAGGRPARRKSSAAVFEVDLNNSTPAADTTVVSITNTSATAILAHWVIWTDLGVPALEFNTYLTGYDLFRLNLQQLIQTGNMPQTASAGQDPTDTISPKGAFSQDIN